jgi:hypothetical protein
MGTTTNYALRYPAETDAPDGATQIENLANDVDAAIASAVAGQFVQPLFARKAISEGRASTTTLANDTSLKLSGLISGAIYEVDMLVLYDGAASSGGTIGCLKWTFTTPTGSSGQYSYARENESGVYSGAYPAAWTDTVNANSTGVSAPMNVVMRGMLVAGANGILQFQWAQDHSSATNTHVNQNSYMTARRVA